ncbi:hypothetical protein Mapa_008511 [Marchantia paleacea]|nr:hypothetical protein Mapa_008511 [Marchantia paleacea]
MYDIDALTIGNAESAVRKLIDSLSQFRSTSASQASQTLEGEVNHFQIALNEILRLLTEDLPSTVSLDAPAIDRFVGKLNKATDYVQSVSQYGSGFPDLRVIKLELAALRQEVGDSFFSTFDEQHWASRNSPLQKKISASAKESKEGKERRLIKGDEDAEEEDDYYDPITYELMCDPVKGSDGHTYDRWTIIDHNMTQSPFDQRKHKPFFIACDDLNVRSSLFEKFGSSGVVDTFHERRRSYRQQAIELAKQKNHDRDDSEVLKMLNHILEWAPEDRECQELRDSIVGRSRPSRHSSDQSLGLFESDSIVDSLDSDSQHIQRSSSFRNREYATREPYPYPVTRERRPRSPALDERPLSGLCGCFFGTCCVCVVMCCLLCMGRVDEDRLFYNRRRAREGRFED